MVANLNMSTMCRAAAIVVRPTSRFAVTMRFGASAFTLACIDSCEVVHHVTSHVVRSLLHGPVQVCFCVCGQHERFFLVVRLDLVVGHGQLCHAASHTGGAGIVRLLTGALFELCVFPCC